MQISFFNSIFLGCKGPLYILTHMKKDVYKVVDWIVDCFSNVWCRRTIQFHEVVNSEYSCH